MSGLRYTLLDVFTAERLAGNQLAVVHDADALSEEVMHAFARETKLSETSFLQSPVRDGASYRHRIWMMSGEIPMAGHPSLGAAVAVARARGEARATYVQETPAGLQPVDVDARGDVARASMLQEPPDFGPELDAAEVLATVGLQAGDADPRLPVQVVATGAPQVLACVRDAQRLAELRPDYPAIEALRARHDAVVLYVAAVDPASGTARARSFIGAEAGEDPATGAAAGPLVAHVSARTGVSSLDISQGVEMGRPSRLQASVEGDRVRVGGDVVVVADGHVHLM